MSTDENKAVVRRFGSELLNKGNFAVADEILSSDFAIHGFAGIPPTRQGFEQILGMFRTAFPDWVDTIEDLIAEDDRVAARITGRGTHLGEFMGIPPTGKQVTVSAIALYRIADGKIAEDRVQLDQLGMMQQLGVIPTPGQATQEA